MNKIIKRLLIFILEMVAFCAIMILGIIYNSKIFAIGIWVFFVLVICIEIPSTLKDIIILIVIILVFAIVGVGIDKLVSYFLGNDTIIGFIVTNVLLFTFYLLLLSCFLPKWSKNCKMHKNEK